jgi:hypothetical protein
MSIVFDPPELPELEELELFLLLEPQAASASTATASRPPIVALPRIRMLLLC